MRQEIPSDYQNNFSLFPIFFLASRHFLYSSYPAFCYPGSDKLFQISGGTRPANPGKNEHYPCKPEDHRLKAYHSTGLPATLFQQRPLFPPLPETRIRHHPCNQQRLQITRVSPDCHVTPGSTPTGDKTQHLSIRTVPPHKQPNPRKDFHLHSCKIRKVCSPDRSPPYLPST